MWILTGYCSINAIGQVRTVPCTCAQPLCRSRFTGELGLRRHLGALIYQALRTRSGADIAYVTARIAVSLMFMCFSFKNKADTTDREQGFVPTEHA